MVSTLYTDQGCSVVEDSCVDVTRQSLTHTHLGRVCGHWQMTDYAAAKGSRHMVACNLRRYSGVTILLPLQPARPALHVIASLSL